MWPATTFDDRDWNGNRARGWSVGGRLRDRQTRLVQATREARRAIAQQTDHNYARMMTVSSFADERRQATQSRWAGQFTTLIFIFAQPDSQTMRSLDARGAYFDARTGDTWDAYFAGYYTSDQPQLEREVGAQRVGSSHAQNWYFNPTEFNSFRFDIESACERRWQYSGGSDVVAVNAWIPSTGAPTIDWHSVVSGSLSDSDEGTLTGTLAQIVEEVSRDLEEDRQDPQFGIARLSSGPAKEASDSSAKKVLIGAVGGFFAAVGKKAAGL